jgi:hypothetical protein
MQDDAGCRHACVATTNIHLDTSGTVAECSDAKVDHVATKLVTSVVFSDCVGKPYVPNNGSRSCLGWLATGGENVGEAEANLQLAISQLAMKLI